MKQLRLQARAHLADLVQEHRSLEMSDKTLSNWVRRVRRGQPLSHRGPTPEVTDAQAELSRLRAENAQLKLDKEILKKAAAYFVRESR